MPHKKMPLPKIIKVELENSYYLVTQHNSVCDGGVNKAAVPTEAWKGGYASMCTSYIIKGDLDID